jgi:hypothetical protein
LNDSVVSLRIARCDRSVVAQSGVVNQEVDLDPVLLKPLNEFADLRFVAKIDNAGVDLQLRIAIPKLFAQLIQSLLAPGDQNDSSGSARELSRKFTANSRRSAGDERAAVIYVHLTTKITKNTKHENKISNFFVHFVPFVVEVPEQ